MEATTTIVQNINAKGSIFVIKEDYSIMILTFGGLIFGQNPFYHPISHLIPVDPSSIGIFCSKRSSLPSAELWLGWPNPGSPRFVMKPLSSRLTIYGITAIPLHSLFSFLFYISTIPYQPLAMSISSHHHEQSLNLTEEEALVHEFDNISVRLDASPQSFFLVAKILTPKTIKADWVANAMKDAWIVRCPFSFSYYHSGMFLVRFGCEGDRRRVMEGQPWHFDLNLILFALPDEFDTVVPSQVHLIPFGKRSTGLAKFLAPEKSVYKKSTFDLSNSTLFEESSSRSSVSNQSLQDAINQFLVPNMVNTSLTLDVFTDVPRSDHSTSGLSMTSSVPSFVGIPSLPCSLPVAPIMTTSVISSVDKGKAVMVSKCPRIILSPPPMNLSGVKRSFTRQNV
ncbi:hypothetical protein F8388_003217 [Cannabis sativa]|uniref:DUF4283 domain-containing protein n=1 Tax=Cannabis sativa TaxID=3483 RepID=A0A7J6FLU5_CANSA|nr:hypothetical protein F8388_003217 [Cannabis sativa]